jgi:subtilisin family serine protease
MTSPTPSRRQLIAGASLATGATAVAFAAPAGAAAPVAAAGRLTPDQALQRLKNGNAALWPTGQ